VLKSAFKLCCQFNLRGYIKGVNDILGSGATGDGRMVDISAFWRWVWGRGSHSSSFQLNLSPI
jgi:hypothetical protein